MRISRIDKFLIRGPRPTDQDIVDLKNIHNIERIVCLESGLFEFVKDDVYDEVNMCTITKTAFYGISMNVFFPPTIYQIRHALQRISTTDFTYVHCKSGVDRTGVVIAAYRVINGMPIDDAIDEMKEMGFHWWYYWWIPIIRRTLREL